MKQQVSISISRFKQPHRAEIFLLLTTNWVQAEEIIHVVTADGSLLGDSAADDDFSCAFSKPGGSVYLTTAHRVSGTTLKCPVPNLDSLISSTESGLDIVIGLCSLLKSLPPFAPALQARACDMREGTAPSSLAPVNGTEAGGTTVVVVDSSTVLGFGANVPSCRFGSIYPVAGTSRHRIRENRLCGTGAYWRHHSSQHSTFGSWTHSVGV